LEIIEKPLSKKQRKELEPFVSISTTILRVSVYVIFIGVPFPVSQKREPLGYEDAKALGCFHNNYIVLDDDAKKLLQVA